MPENTFFRQPETQRMLLDILFVWCKLHQDVSYRQGMHELLAPILWIVERDAIDLGPSSKAHGEDVIVRTVFDAESIEHDAFALFGQLMQSAKGFYEQTTHQGNENPIVARSRRIFEEMLPQVDPELAEHLRRIDIVPQVFLIRWVRLLFGREFPFDDMLALWDIIFAEDTTLEIVDHICLAMLLRIRWDLLDSDYNNALTILLRYPQPDRHHPAQTYALDALYLRDHFDTDGSGYLILNHTGRPLQPHGGPATPPALQRNITAFSGLPSAISPTTRPSAAKRQSTNFETMLQSTAKQIYARGGKAMRTAVDEVHKRAQEIRDAQTPSLPPRASSYSKGGPSALYKRIATMEKRNRDLAKLLQGAVGELWEHQRLVSEEKEEGAEKEGLKREENVERLSLAIARVQFVQVYLGDASLPLPDIEGSEAFEGSEKAVNDRGEIRGAFQPEGAGALDEKAELRESTAAATDKDPRVSSFRESSGYDHDALADPATFDFDDSGRATPVTTSAPSVPSNRAISVQPPTASDNRLQTPPTNHTRPPLSEGQYSWMLGENQEASVNAGPARMSTPDRISKGRAGFLFGDGGGDDGVGSKEVTTRSPRGKTRRQKAKGEVVKEGEGGLGSGSGEDGLND